MMSSHTAPRWLVRAAVPLASCATLMSACVSSDLLGPADNRPVSISLTLQTPALLASLGDTATVAPRVLNAGGDRVAHPEIRWSVSPAGVLQQDGDGVFRAVGNGQVTIIASIDVGQTGVRPSGYWAAAHADTVTVEVRQRAVHISLVPVDTAFTTLGAHRTVQVRLTDARGNVVTDSLPPLTFASDKPGIISVDSTGVVKSVAEGSGIVTVTAAGLKGALSFSVQPRRPHTSCMVFSQRRQSKQSCVTVDLTLRERGATP